MWRDAAIRTGRRRWGALRCPSGWWQIGKANAGVEAGAMLFPQRAMPQPTVQYSQRGMPAYRQGLKPRVVKDFAARLKPRPFKTTNRIRPNQGPASLLAQAPSLRRRPFKTGCETSLVGAAIALRRRQRIVGSRGFWGGLLGCHLRRGLLSRLRRIARHQPLHPCGRDVSFLPRGLGHGRRKSAIAAARSKDDSI